MDESATSKEPGPAGASAAGLRASLLDLVRARGYERRAEPFRLSSGGSSHDYVDLRRAVARGEDLALAARAVLAALGERSVSFEAIGGMTMGADPVAHAAALLSGRSWYSVRKQSKSYGTGRRVEGAALAPGVRAVLFEDTVSTGRSALESLEVVAGTGATVVLACTLLDRGDQAAPAFAAAGVPYLALLSYKDLGIEALGAASPPERPAG